MIPGLWLSEGGQSAAGDALDRLVRMHPALPALEAETGGRVLARLTERAMADPTAAVARAAHLTVVPDFNGNRAPLADPHARAIVAGLGTAVDEASLQDLFVAGLVGVACGLRHILDAQAEAGLATETIVISGGAGANPLARRILADVTGRPVAVPATPEPVLLGAAMLGAVAGGMRKDIPAAMAAMARTAETIVPDPAIGVQHDRTYRRFRALQEAARAGG